jgi:hypothetical protein
VERTQLLWFVGLSGTLAAFGLALGALIVPPTLPARLFVGVQWLAFSLVLAYLILFRGD